MTTFVITLRAEFDADNIQHARKLSETLQREWTNVAVQRYCGRCNASTALSTLQQDNDSASLRDLATDLAVALWNSVDNPGKHVDDLLNESRRRGLLP
jgi:hypothetical protein